MRTTMALLGAGVVLLVVGIGLLSVPGAFIAAGVGAIAVALWVDVEERPK